MRRHNFGVVLGLMIIAMVGLNSLQKCQAQEKMQGNNLGVIEQSQQVKPKLLLFEGLFHEFWGLDKVVNLLGGKIKSSSHIRSWTGTALTYFPKDEDELMTYDVVVMVNVDIESLADKSKYVEPYTAPGSSLVLDVSSAMGGTMGPDILKDFVEGGGGLLILGGHSAYGQGGYEKAPFSALLPVQVGKPFDVVAIDKPTPIEPVGKSIITKGILWKDTPLCFYIHDLKPKQDSQVILICGETPFLIIGHYGKGRVAAMLGTVYGEPKQGEIAFWEWSEWPKLMQNLMIWLLRKETE